LDDFDWKKMGRIGVKTAVFILLLNLTFALLTPMETLGRLSLYNSILTGRERLPYGEVPAESYSLSLYNIPAMFASHTLSQPKADGEFRVIIIGDSATWGWFLDNADTLAGQLNAINTDDAIRFYNLGYPVMSLTKDVMILDEAMAHAPDLIIWPITLESFPREKQVFPPIVQENAGRIRPLISQYNLNVNGENSFTSPSFLDETIIGQRRNLADLLRLQQYGFSWTATGIDQTIPADPPLRKSNFDEDVSWQTFDEPIALTHDVLAFDVLEAGFAIAGDVPILLINEPIFISDGANSDLRYNAFYPRWAYDQYRVLLAETAVSNQWHYLDAWDAVDGEQFGDTAVHLTPAGMRLFAKMVQENSAIITGAN
jgi:hypothetical protein